MLGPMKLIEQARCRNKTWPKIIVNFLIKTHFASCNTCILKLMGNLQPWFKNLIWDEIVVLMVNLNLYQLLGVRMNSGVEGYTAGNRCNIITMCTISRLFFGQQCMYMHWYGEMPRICHCYLGHEVPLHRVNKIDHYKAYFTKTQPVPSSVT